MQRVRLSSVAAQRRLRENETLCMRVRQVWPLRQSQEEDLLTLQLQEEGSKFDGAAKRLDLVLHGRWATNCQWIADKASVYIQSVTVEPEAGRFVVHVGRGTQRDPARLAIRLASWSNARSRVQLVDETLEREIPGIPRRAVRPRVPDQPGGASASGKRRRFKLPSGAPAASLTAAGTRAAKSIAQLSVGDGHVFAVVRDFDAPRRTRGRDMMMTMTLFDETGELSCVLFHPTVAMFPVVRVGDVIRVHRMRFQLHLGQLQGTSCPGVAYRVIGPEDPLEPPPSWSGTWTLADSERVQQLRRFIAEHGADKLNSSYVCALADLERGKVSDVIVQVVGRALADAQTKQHLTLQVQDASSAPIAVSIMMRDPLLLQRISSIPIKSWVKIRCVHSTGPTEAMITESPPGNVTLLSEDDPRIQPVPGLRLSCTSAVKNVPLRGLSAVRTVVPGALPAVLRVSHAAVLAYEPAAVRGWVRRVCQSCCSTAQAPDSSQSPLQACERCGRAYDSRSWTAEGALFLAEKPDTPPVCVMVPQGLIWRLTGLAASASPDELASLPDNAALLSDLQQRLDALVAAGPVHDLALLHVLGSDYDFVQVFETEA